MFEQGLLDEARELFARYPQRPKSLNSVGLKECGEFLRGEIKTKAELEEQPTGARPVVALPREAEKVQVHDAVVQRRRCSPREGGESGAPHPAPQPS